MKCQWLEHRWLVLPWPIQTRFWVPRKFFDSSRKQILRDILGNFSYFIMKIYVVCAQFTHLIEAILIFSTLWANSADEKSVMFCRPHMSKDTFSDVAALLYLACDGSCSYPRFLALIYIVSLSVMCRPSQQYVFLSFVLFCISLVCPFQVSLWSQQLSLH